MARKTEDWWLSVNGHVVGTGHKSLTNKLLFSRYIACQVITALRLAKVDVSEVTVAIVCDGEVKAEDKF